MSKGKGHKDIEEGITMIENTKSIDTLALIEAIEDIIVADDYFKGTPELKEENPNLRRRFKLFGELPKVEWEEDGHSFTAQHKCFEEDNTLYYVGIYTKDGHRTSLDEIKSSLTRIKEV